VLSTALWLSCGSGDQKGVIYLVGQSDETVGAYQLNLKTGILFTSNNALAWIGTKAKTGAQPNVLLFNPGKTTAYVSDGGSSDIASYSVNHDGSLAAGAVTKLKGPATNPVAMAMDPGGKFLFVADQGVPGDTNCGAKGLNPAECQAGISVFAVSSGALTEVPGSPFHLLTSQQTTSFPAPVIPAGVAVANSGNFVYATDQANNILLGFSFDGTTGVLTPLTSTMQPALWPVIVGSSPSGVFSLTINDFLYVTNAVSNNIDEFKINSNDGSLTTVVGSPVSAGVGPTVMFSDPNAKYLFAVGTGSNQLLGYRVNQVTGALTALTPAFVSTGSTPVAATIRSNGVLNGDYWIVVSDNGANAVSTIEFINSTGAMSVLPQITGPVAPFGIASR
jgi:6-phosphogluconolactonase (cycloisomerase 2 family)